MRHRTNRLKKPPRPSAFSLIEILVVITIIGILMALLVPAAQGVIHRAKVAQIKVTLTQLEQAVEDYRNKYGDYPPDFSDQSLTDRHFRKAFPKISPVDMSLLAQAVTDGNGSFDGVQIDRAEALVFTLGGFSTDPVHPFTGPGGPLEFIGDPTDNQQVGDLAYYQYNSSRSNPLYEFPSNQLSLTQVNAAATLTTTNKYASTDEADMATGTQADIFPVFIQSGRKAPYLYFDHRTYGYLPGLNNFNGYVSNVGAIRPYKSEKAVLKTGTAAYGTPAAAVEAYEFVNPQSFQIISAGIDDRFGTVVGGVTSSGPPPGYFMYPSGAYFLADPNATSPGAMVSGSRYQETSINTNTLFNEHTDNIANFSKGELADELK